MAETKQSNVRLNKQDIKHIDIVKKLMRRANIPEQYITKSSAIQFALKQTASTETK